MCLVCLFPHVLRQCDWRLLCQIPLAQALLAFAEACPPQAFVQKTGNARRRADVNQTKRHQNDNNPSMHIRHRAPYN